MAGNAPALARVKHVAAARAYDAEHGAPRAPGPPRSRARPSGSGSPTSAAPAGWARTRNGPRAARGSSPTSPRTGTGAMARHRPTSRSPAGRAAVSSPGERWLTSVAGPGRAAAACRGSAMTSSPVTAGVWPRRRGSVRRGRCGGPGAPWSGPARAGRGRPRPGPSGWQRFPTGTGTFERADRHLAFEGTDGGGQRPLGEAEAGGGAGGCHLRDGDQVARLVRVRGGVSSRRRRGGGG